MTLAPFLLAAFFGLLISALLYFVLVWPAREPDDNDDNDDLDHPGNAVIDRRAGKVARSAGAAAGGDPA